MEKILLCLLSLLLVSSAAAQTLKRNSLDRSQQPKPIEITASFVAPELHDSVWMEAYVPAGVPVVRGVIAFIDRDLDRYAYDDRDWRAMCARARCALLRLGLPRQDEKPPSAQIVRNAAVGGGAILLHTLAVAAERTHHPEFRDANVLLFGFSAAGNFGPTFASWRPDRTIGFIEYHSNLRGIDVDTTKLATVPALIIVGARDDPARSEDSRTLWQLMRSQNAPWAFASHLGQPHKSIDGLVEAGPLMRSWAEAVLASRLNSTPSGKSFRLVPVQLPDGWLVDDSTKVAAPVASFAESRLRASWVPTATVAQELRLLSGVCATVPLLEVKAALGGEPTIRTEDIATCRYTSGTPAQDLWLTTNRLPSPSGAQAELEQARRAANGQNQVGLGESAFFVADAARKCSTLGVARVDRTFYAVLCGDGFGKASDTVYLQRLAKHLVGEQ